MFEDERVELLDGVIVQMSPLPKDLGAEARIDAEAGVPEHWAVDVTARTIVVHRSPTATGYAAISTHHAGQRVAPTAFPDVELEIAALFA